jgi:hypothetical protein
LESAADVVDGRHHSSGYGDYGKRQQKDPNTIKGNNTLSCYD